MKRLVPVFLILVLFCCASVASAAESVPTHIHLVVVPETLDDGSSSEDAVVQFEKEVIRLAGGFTELGASRGGDIVDGDVEYQDNISFLIGADRDISRELHKLTIKLFGGSGAFIMAWPGTMIY